MINKMMRFFRLKSAALVFAGLAASLAVREAGMAPAFGLRAQESAAVRTIGRPIVTYGDSLARGMGINLRDDFTNVVNLGRDGAGYMSGIRPLPASRIPGNSVVLISLGTNDIGTMIKDSTYDVRYYAISLTNLARRLKAQRCTPVIVGMQAPDKPYAFADGTPWPPSYFRAWKEKMASLNRALENECRRRNILYVPADDIGPRAGDGLHYEDQGYDQLAFRALKAAGVETAAATHP